MRDVLRYARKDDTIRDTLEALINASKRAGTRFDELALDLGTEYIISSEKIDLDDLVAVCFSKDFPDRVDAKTLN